MLALVGDLCLLCAVYSGGLPPPYGQSPPPPHAPSPAPGPAPGTASPPPDGHSPPAYGPSPAPGSPSPAHGHSPSPHAPSPAPGSPSPSHGHSPRPGNVTLPGEGPSPSPGSPSPLPQSPHGRRYPVNALAALPKRWRVQARTPNGLNARVVYQLHLVYCHCNVMKKQEASLQAFVVLRLTDILLMAWLLMRRWRLLSTQPGATCA